MAWEQRKLGEITNSYSGGTPSVGIDEYYDGKIPFIRSGEINSESTEFFLTETGLNNSSAKMVNVGDILYALYGATSGEVGVSRICGAINQAILAIIPDNGYDTYFIMQWLRREKQNIVSTYLQGGQGNLSGTIVKDLTIDFPNTYIEQEKIGGFFRNLDNLITLHQRKLDKTKKLRKAFLNLIFSQKLRFRGFDQSWRKLKIEDCFSERVERSEKGELISVTVNFGIVKAHSLDRKDNSSENKSNYKIVRKDDIAYNSMRMWQGASGISLYEGILSPAYTVIIPKQGVSSLFFSYEFKLKKMLQTFQVNSQGLTSDTWNLKFPLLRNIVVEAPEYEEQEKVGIFFKKLDNLITHHQDKINQLTKLKTTFLKNMFI
ncbi:restriction endonuclease subunit S [uncultured Phascolarctobacterium sp.]|uniref:restriction endonuclease subunit S n=1 Tax=uncultured Phascolarctobacterium sp. TaxID=512296 RepID=UPI0025ECFC00|nr:restriction endonuclease subunit S [uncultured Phascolarctobacterium sp.]